MRNLLFSGCLAFVCAVGSAFANPMESSAPTQDVVAVQEGVPTITLESVLPGVTSFRLIFSVSSSPTSIIVERALSESGPWTQRGTVGQGGLSYYDTGVDLAVTYYYRVTAVYAESSSTSAVVSGVLPAPVLNLGLHSLGSQQVTLQTYNSNTSFVITLQRRVEPSGDWLNYSSGTTTSWVYKDSGLIPETTYSYRLETIQVGLTPVYSNVITVTTPSLRTPPTPTNFRVSYDNTYELRFDWDQGAFETHYRVERARVSDMIWTTESSSLIWANTPYYWTRPLNPNTAYYYRVIAINAQGESSPSVPVLVQSMPLRAVLEDDFDPIYDADLWADVSAGTSILSGLFMSPNSCLHFAKGGHAQTRPLSIPTGGVVEFYIRAGNERLDGPLWKNSVVGERLLLEYSTDGSQWTLLQSLDPVYPSLSSWSRYYIALPEAARSTTTSFRWRHESTTETQGSWALESVIISKERIDHPGITFQPRSQFIASGESASFTVTARNPETVSYQWYKGDTPISGATAATYTLTSAQPSDGAYYKCAVTYRGVVLETDTVYLAVLEAVTPSPLLVELGGTFDLEVKVHPAGLPHLRYDWTVPGVDIGTVSGLSSPKLTVTGATARAQMNYYYTVHDQSSWGIRPGAFTVRMHQPPLITPIPAQYAAVGMPVSILLTTTDPAATFNVSGLPKGLYFDAPSSSIKGEAQKAQVSTISVSASNAYGTSEKTTFTLQTSLLPYVTAGSYRGVFIYWGEELKYGAQLSFQTTDRGSVSGSITLNGKSHRFVSPIHKSDSGNFSEFETRFKDHKSGRELKLRVEMREWGGSVGTTISTASGGEFWAEGSAVLRASSAHSSTSRPEMINVVIRQYEDFAGLGPLPPMGVGYLNLSVKKQGTVTIKGRLADGQVVVSSTIMNKRGRMPIYTSLYRNTGSFVCDATATPEVQDIAYWRKDPQPDNSKDRSYKEGFSGLSISMDGGPYTRPAVNKSAFAEASDLPLEGYLKLSGPGPETLIELEQSFTLNKGNKAVFPRSLVLNPHKFTLKLNPATGVFSGTFKLEDENPANLRQIFRRTVPFYGCVAGSEALGHFLIPELPQDEKSKTPIWSGQVELLQRED